MNTYDKWMFEAEEGLRNYTGDLEEVVEELSENIFTLSERIEKLEDELQTMRLERELNKTGQEKPNV